MSEFKKELLYTDEAKQKKLTQDYISNLEKINKYIFECENLLKKTLTKKEIQSILKNPIEHSNSVKEIIKEGFQFPNASIQFNLDAQGLSFDNLNSLTNELPKIPLNYLIDSGRIIVEPKQLKSIEEQSKVFTQNEKQNQIFKLAKTLKECSSKLIELGISYSGTLYNYGNATNNLVLNDSKGLKVNVQKILSLK